MWPVLSNLINVGLVLVSCDAIASLCEEAFMLFVVGLASIASFDHGQQLMQQHGGVAMLWC